MASEISVLQADGQAGSGAVRVWGWRECKECGARFYSQWGSRCESCKCAYWLKVYADRGVEIDLWCANGRTTEIYR